MPTIVVGAGVIGVTIAYELQKRGRKVTLLDKAGPGLGASYGNMASIAVTEFMPIARPSIWRKMPGWMLDPKGPVSIRPAYIPKLVPWFLRFLAASMPSRVKALEAHGAVLGQRVHEDLGALLHETGLEGELSEQGCLSLYRDDDELRADREHMEVLDRFGFRVRHLSGDEARELEPALSPKFRHVVLFPQNRRLRDPYTFVRSLAERFTALGGQIEKGEVAGFTRDESIQEVLLADGRKLPAKQVVVCAGVHSARLARGLGEPIPLETERGYHTQIMSPGISMNHSLIWPARAFMVTPTAGGIRVGGTVELAGIDAPPDYRRSRITVAHAKEALPGLRSEDSSEWMGHRPAFPDTLPVISPSAKTKGLYYATGHGHLGLTFAATTARLLADIMTGIVPPVDMRPYRVDRF